MTNQNPEFSTRSSRKVFLFFYLQERIFLSVSNYIFTVIFVAEMTVKVNEIVRIKITNHGDDYGGEGTKPVIQTV